MGETAVRAGTRVPRQPRPPPPEKLAALKEGGWAGRRDSGLESPRAGGLAGREPGVAKEPGEGDIRERGRPWKAGRVGVAVPVG